MLAIIIWWIVSARKWFKGPKVNIEHQMLGRDGDILYVKEVGNDSGGSSSGSITKDDQRIVEDNNAGALA